MWTQITNGDYGFIGQLTLAEDGTALDISDYTTRQFLLRDPTGTVTAVTATFETDGDDGSLIHEFVTGEIDMPGVWQVRARIIKTGAQLTSQYLSFAVDA